MRNEAIVVAFIAGVFGLIGNLVTSFGPAWVSWHQKPEFVDTPSYKKMREENPKFEEKLKARLTESKYAIRNRQAEFRLLRRENDVIIAELTQTSEIVNLSEDEVTAELRGSMQFETTLISADITPVGQSGKHFDEKSLHDMTKSSNGGNSEVVIPYSIGPKQSVTTRTVYRFRKPATGIEPLVVNKIMLGTYSVTVDVDPSLGQCLPIDSESFTFDKTISKTTENSKTKFEMIGPLLPGQGMGLSWSCPLGTPSSAQPTAPRDASPQKRGSRP
ncbi:hypothetical protein [Leptothrix ochracea]|uniref:hypothetical protein n=1 Tax=Leptothrix ochracea TaxID=735331 RepID=UPI0034E24D0B